jgi:hypothetical protein
MRTVKLKVHYVRGTQPQFSVQTLELSRLYRTAGIELYFFAAPEILIDPALGTAWENYSDIVARLRTNDKLHGHLIVGKRPPTSSLELAGQLLDLDLRGVAVVYTHSDYIKQNPRLNFLQTCAHEIGHMLNLSHRNIAKTYTSAMEQLGGRTGDVATCWELADGESAKVKTKGGNPYFEHPVEAISCYPLAYTARVELNTLSEIRLQPWQSKFEHALDGSNDCCHATNLRIDYNRRR